MSTSTLEKVTFKGQRYFAVSATNDNRPDLSMPKDAMVLVAPELLNSEDSEYLTPEASMMLTLFGEVGGLLYAGDGVVRNRSWAAGDVESIAATILLGTIDEITEGWATQDAEAA